MKQYSSDSSSSDSDLSKKIDYKSKKRGKNMRKINGKVTDGSVWIEDNRFKLNEDPIQRRIYFLTFIESLEMIFSQYKENFEVLLYYPKIGGKNKKDYA